MSWIQTYTGKKFYPLDPDPDLLDIRDIAHALSLQCRYIGHTSRFYSVAEHSTRISNQLSPKWVQSAWGLVHDASEAYLGDVARPIKMHPAMQAYRDAEKHLQGVIVKWLGLPPEEPPEVKALDVEILGTEAPELLGRVHPDWASTTATGELPPAWPGVGKLLGWHPEMAEMLFRARFTDLFGCDTLYFSRRT